MTTTADDTAERQKLARAHFDAAERIVVKVGSALLVDAETGRPRSEWLAALMDDVAGLVKAGKRVVLVSSGAIALGRNQLRLPRGPLSLEHSQASAAVGQISLAHAYQSLATDRQMTVAQILLTLGDTEERRRYLNARETINVLLKLGTIPVVNENDTVATSEIRYGDNDRLSARVASMVSADCLVLLSDIDGLYSAPPLTNPDARHIGVVTTITPEIEGMAGDVGSELSRGGMRTKIEAAKVAVASGANMVITSGKVMNPLKSLAEGGKATWFLASSDPMTARKRWISGQLVPTGEIFIDSGAEKALISGSSLLPAGVVKVRGAFGRGDVVIIRNAKGGELGRGLTAYSSEDAQRIIGKQSCEIAAILGYEGRVTLIHRDDMTLNKV